MHIRGVNIRARAQQRGDAPKVRAAHRAMEGGGALRVRGKHEVPRGGQQRSKRLLARVRVGNKLVEGRVARAWVRRGVLHCQKWERAFRRGGGAGDAALR